MPEHSDVVMTFTIFHLLQIYYSLSYTFYLDPAELYISDGETVLIVQLLR